MARISERIELVRTIYSDNCIIKLERSNSESGDAKIRIKDFATSTEASAQLDSDTIIKLIQSLSDLSKGIPFAYSAFSAVL